MSDLDIFSFFNILITGIIIMMALAIFINSCKKLNPMIHSVFWFFIFIYLLVYNFESSSIPDLKLNYSNSILFFIPVFGFIYILSLKNKKLLPYSLFIFIIPIIAIYLRLKILLFPIFYDLISWAVLIIIAFIFAKSKNKTIKQKHESYIFIWTILTSIGFICNGLMNIVLTIINKYPIQILTLLPLYITCSSLIVFIYFNKINKYYNNEEIKETSMFDKLTVIEKIAASLIHEIKNPIAAIQSLNQQMQTRLHEMSDDDKNKYLSIIEKDLDRIKNLADSFLKIYKKDSTINSNPIDVYLTLQSVYELIKFDLMKKEISFNLDKSLINKKAYISNHQSRQIFLNLIYNSIEANAKNIRIYCDFDNENLEIFIQDDGNGIKFMDLHKIFNPFYTTKPDGIGMGLSIIKKILEQNNADIKLVSSNNGKTIFKLILKT